MLRVNLSWFRVFCPHVKRRLGDDHGALLQDGEYVQSHG